MSAGFSCWKWDIRQKRHQGRSHISPGTLSHSCKKKKMFIIWRQCTSWLLFNYQAPIGSLHRAAYFPKTNFLVFRWAQVKPPRTYLLAFIGKRPAPLSSHLYNQWQTDTYPSLQQPPPSILTKPDIKTCSSTHGLHTGFVPQMFQGFLGTMLLLLVCLVCCSDEISCNKYLFHLHVSGLRHLFACG